MLHWYKKEKTFRWQREGGWFLEIKRYYIQFWTPEIMYFFGWWNPHTHKLLIRVERLNIPHPEP